MATTADDGPNDRLPGAGGVRHRVPASACYACGTPMSGAAGHPTVPTEGDIGVCIRCLAVNVYGGDVTLRQPLPSEQGEIDNDADIQRVLRTLKRSRDNRRG